METTTQGHDTLATTSQKTQFTTGHFASLEEAGALTRRHRESAPTGTRKGSFFAQNIFMKILAQPECHGIRFRYAVEPDGGWTVVLSGVDQNGADLFDGILGEEGLPCPPFCPAPNALNSNVYAAHFTNPGRSEHFTPDRNHFVTRAAALEYIRSFCRVTGIDEAPSVTVVSEDVVALLRQEDCIGLRIYFALTDDGDRTLVLTGTSATGEDLIHGPVCMGS